MTTPAGRLTHVGADAILAGLADSQGMPASGPEPLAVAETTAAPLPEGNAMHPDDHGPAPLDAALHLLTDHLIEELRSGDFPPALVHISVGDADGFELGVRPLEGRHPSDLLIGFDAPVDWHALGVASAGWAYHLSERGSRHRHRTRVHVVTVISRTGEFVHRTRVDGDDELGSLLSDPAAKPPGGEPVDQLRRALGLATDEPPCGTDVYWTIEWLSELLGRNGCDLSRWTDVVAAHPAVAMATRSAPRDLRSDEEDHLVAIAGTFADVFSWPRLRSLLSEGRFDFPELAPEDGPWFDDGSFARFVLNRCPPLAMLRRQVAGHLDPDLADRLGETLSHLGIPSSAWPDEAGDRAA